MFYCLSNLQRSLLEPTRAETYLFLLFNHVQIHSERLTSFRQLCSDRHFVNQISKTMGKRVIFTRKGGGGGGGERAGQPFGQKFAQVALTSTYI